MTTSEMCDTKGGNLTNRESDSGLSSLSDARSLRQTFDVDDSFEVSLPTFDFQKSKHKAGISLITGQTVNETKARKLNKTEESRLESLRSHFENQKTMMEKELNLSEQRFRIRSARVLQNSNLTKSYEDMRRRPMSLPVHLPSHQLDLFKPDLSKQNSVPARCKSERTCPTCERIQNIMHQYEKEMKLNFDIHSTHHTICLFSDKQIENFIQLVETQYCADLPGVAEMLRSTKSLHHRNPFSRGTAKSKSGINDRIRAFCTAQDTFNKEHPVPKSVKSFVDLERIKQAKLATQVKK